MVEEYNPRYFDEPKEYKPSRWYGVSNEFEAFSAFSLGIFFPCKPPAFVRLTLNYPGPRTCLGRKFATTEAVAFLTMLLRDWKIEPILRPGESKQEWRNRVLDGQIALTLGVKDVSVKFTRRPRA